MRFEENALSMPFAKYNLKMLTINRDTHSWTSKWPAMGNDPVMVTWLYTLKYDNDCYSIYEGSAQNNQSTSRNIS